MSYHPALTLLFHLITAIACGGHRASALALPSMSRLLCWLFLSISGCSFLPLIFTDEFVFFLSSVATSSIIKTGNNNMNQIWMYENQNRTENVTLCPFKESTTSRLKDECTCVYTYTGRVNGISRPPVKPSFANIWQNSWKNLLMN